MGEKLALCTPLVTLVRAPNFARGAAAPPNSPSSLAMARGALPGSLACSALPAARPRTAPVSTFAVMSVRGWLAFGRVCK